MKVGRLKCSKCLRKIQQVAPSRLCKYAKGSGDREIAAFGLASVIQVVNDQTIRFYGFCKINCFQLSPIQNFQ
jgi:hypothetical protein